MLKLSICLNILLLIVGFVFVSQQLSINREATIWHDGNSLPVKYDVPVIYYRISTDPFDVIVRYAYVDSFNIWREWQDLNDWTKPDIKLLPPTWWAYDPTAAR